MEKVKNKTARDGKGTAYPGVTIVYFCHDGKGNFLLNKRGARARDERGKWDPGGGGLEFGESVDETLRRELKEEYGVDPLEVEFLGYRDIHRSENGAPTHWLALDFKVRVDRERTRNAEPHKFDGIGWFSLDALPSPLHSQMRPALEKYKTRLGVW